MAGRRISWGVLYGVLLLVGLVAIIGPSDLAWSRGFMEGTSGGPIGPHGRLILGDSVQNAYVLWLWWHALVTRSHLPWSDPFQFALTGHTTLQVGGWPLVLVSIPVQALFGPIAAYNATFYAAFVAAGACAYLLARRLGLPRGPAAVAGFAYAFAPFRLVQGVHMGSLLGFLLPLVLYLADRALRSPRPRLWAWACAGAYLSLLASGELHLAEYGTLLLATFVIVVARHVPRDRLRRLIVPAAVLLVMTGVAVAFIYVAVLRPSGRSGDAITFATNYAPRPANILERTNLGEYYAYPGAVIGVLAVVGFAKLFGHRRLVAAWLGGIVVASYALAMAPSWGPTFALYKLIPFAGFVRVPGRALAVAVVGLALLAGWGVMALERWRGAAAVVVAILAAIVLDARSAASYFDFTPAGNDVLAAVPVGAPLLDLPPFPADHHGGSRYMLDIMRRPGPRVGGYDVLAPEDVREAQQSTMSLTKVPIDPCAWKSAQSRFGFRYVAVHTDLFGSSPLWPSEGPAPQQDITLANVPVWPVSGWAMVAALQAAPGFHQVSSIEGTVVFRLEPGELACR